MLATTRPGQAISVNETIAAVRKQVPDLSESDCELVELTMREAISFGAFVAFDIHA
ncbi:hypothetical protein [Mesorhizobium sp.]|uniref:hypothetical protein n=1 Tax=Mesorhizobium sp. TaxID=1871066 RepID=UPI0025BADD0F|nr:hypothetical protein [Mesorhizobium sp.]